MKRVFFVMVGSAMLVSACKHAPVDATAAPAPAAAATPAMPAEAPAPAAQIETRPRSIPILSAPAQAIRNWLKLVDAGQYGESWDAAAPMFRSAVARAQWATTIDAVRRPLGAVVTREQTSAKEATSLPGAPDGDYYIYEFATSFEQKKNAVETVTVARGANDQWQVVGYFIR